MIRYNGEGTSRVNSWGAEVGKPEFWPEIEHRIYNASKGNCQKLVILAHDLRKHDVYNLSDIVKKIMSKANEVKVKIKFVTMSEIAKGWKEK